MPPISDSSSPAAALAAQRRWLAHRRSAGDSDLMIGVAASFTADPVEAHLGAALLDVGVQPGFRFAEYNQIHQVCFDPEAALGAVDFVMVLWRLEDLFGTALARAAEGDSASVDEIVAGVAQLGASVASMTSAVQCAVIVSVPPPPRPVGVDTADSVVGLRLAHVHAASLQAFAHALDGTPVRWADLNSWEHEFGAAHSHDVLKSFAYKQPYTSAFWHVVGSHLADIVLCERRPPPKCIVLDCDNTLWGGVIGEDGIGGIELGSAFPGSGFVGFQTVLKALRQRGVLLAIASKNNLHDVEEVFDQHDDMVLKTQDIAVWRVNWSLKSQSLREIAAELNIGVDALVMIDDSDYELAEIATALPEVIRLQAPDEPALLPGLIAASGLFRNMVVSAEDAVRTDMIRQESGRKQSADAMTREEFLASLDLVVDYLAVGEEHVGRIAQLATKTNQFNLTTIRRTEAQVRALLVDADHLVRAIRVGDKFGDYGLVGLAIIDRRDQEWELDTLLMSCRVLGRGVETAFLSTIAREAIARGAHRLVGRYVPTLKNALVADLYPHHGFTEMSSGQFVADLDDVAPVPPHIVVR